MIQLHPACFAICDKAEMMNYLVTLCFFAWEYRSSSNNMNLLWPWCVVISQEDHYTDWIVLFICEVLQSSNMLVWVSFNHFKTLRIGTLNSRCKRCTDLYLCSSFPSLHVIPEQSWWFVPCCVDGPRESSVSAGTTMHSIPLWLISWTSHLCSCMSWICVKLWPTAAWSMFRNFFCLTMYLNLPMYMAV